MNECNIVRDLIPLYADGLASGDSAQLIQAHTQNCPQCRRSLERCMEEVPAMTDQNLTDYKKGIRRGRWKTFLGIVAYILIFAAIAAGAVTWQRWQWGDFSVVESFTSPDGARSFEILDMTTHSGEMRLRQVIGGKYGGKNQHKASFRELDVYWANDSRTCVFMAVNLEGQQEIHIIAQDEQVSGGLWTIDGDLGDIVHILNETCGENQTYVFSHWLSDSETVVFSCQSHTAVLYHYPTGTVSVA